MNIPPRGRPSARFFLACALAAPLASVALAQTAPDDAISLGDYTVTARRVPEDASDVPAYTQVITSQQIQDSDATDLIDLLESQANIQFSSLGGSATDTTVSLRGTGGGSNTGDGRTLIILDGVPQNRIDMGMFNWLQFSLQDIGSIEIIQGPQGAFYGDNAVGGVIKITTKGMPTASGGGASVLVGSDSTLKTAFSYTQLFNDKLWARVSYGYDTSAGWRDYSGYHDNSAAISLGYDNHRYTSTQVNLSYLDNVYEQPGYLSYAQYQQDPAQTGSDPASGWSDYRRITATNTLGFNPDAQLITDGGINLVKEYYNWFDPSYADIHRSMDNYSLSPKFRYKVDAFTFTTGIDASYDWLHAQTATPADGLLSRTTVSPFFAGEWKINSRLALSAAYRHEWDKIVSRQTEAPNSGEGSDLANGNAWQVALNYKPIDSLHVYAKYDHTYRFPATDEISYYQGYYSPVFFNPDLKPEISDNYELGGQFAKHGWSAGASVYLMETRDEIYYNQTTFLNENLAQTQRLGAQVNAGYDDGGLFGVRTRADYVDARVIEVGSSSGLYPGALRMTPAMRLTTTGVARPFKGLELSLTHTYIGSSYIDDSYTSTSPGHVAGVSLFDVKASYKIGEHWRVFVGVNNVFDTSYISYANSYSAYYPGQGRFWYLGTSVRF